MPSLLVSTTCRLEKRHWNLETSLVGVEFSACVCLYLIYNSRYIQSHYGDPCLPSFTDVPFITNFPFIAAKTSGSTAIFSLEFFQLIHFSSIFPPILFFTLVSIFQTFQIGRSWMIRAWGGMGNWTAWTNCLSTFGIPVQRILLKLKVIICCNQFGLLTMRVSRLGFGLTVGPMVLYIHSFNFLNLSKCLFFDDFLLFLLSQLNICRVYLFMLQTENQASRKALKASSRRLRNSKRL